MIKLVHYRWWPGRKFKGECPIPAHYVKQWERKKRRHADYMALIFINFVYAEAVMVCSKSDTIDLNYGKAKCFERLMEAVDKRSKEDLTS